MYILRYDKYEPKGGGYRSPLAAAFPAADLNIGFGTGHDAAGRTVRGVGVTGIKGVLVLTSAKNAGDIIDVMTDGEIVEFPGVAGTNYFADGATGALVPGTGDDTLTPPATPGSKYIGHTVEASRLIVRVGRP